MALWLDPDSAEAQADLDAITALKESAAVELKEKGNEYLKMGKKHYKDAIDCYTRAIDQKSMDAVNMAILYANRSQAHLLLGNYRFALLDAQEAIKLNKANIKAYFRGAKAALALELIHDAAHFCTVGLEQDPTNQELMKLRDSTTKKLVEAAEREKQAVAAVAKAEELIAGLAIRKIKLGKPLYKEHTGGRKPWLDDSKLLHWPVLLLYVEVMTSDLIEDFCEVDSFSVHLDIMFGKDAPPLPWDVRHEYARGNIQLYYKACTGPHLSREQLSQYLLEGSSNRDGLDLEDFTDDHERDDDNQALIQVSQRSTLHDVLAKENYVVPGVPVFYVVSTSSSFYTRFLSGQWTTP